MRVTSVSAASSAPRSQSSRLAPKSVDAVARGLIDAGYIYDDHYLEMKHLDPKWMVAIYVYAVAVRRAFHCQPAPSISIDRT
jgi:hypothetical protein